MVKDAFARLAERFDLKSLPFSEEELRTLTKRARESFRAFGSDGRRARLGKYKAHLSTLHGAECVEEVWAALEKINNEIGCEER